VVAVVAHCAAAPRAIVVMAMTAEPPEPAELPAGELSAWLRQIRRSPALNVLGVDVPCGTCSGCCRASYFIHIAPDETETLKRIPRPLVFAAPGLAKGHVLMGYNDRGECPMWIDRACSIYEHRPRTCRTYDCRVFAATGIDPDDDGTRALVAERVRRWRFDHADDRAHDEHAAVRAAAAFLHDQRARFPPGTVPSNVAQLAVVAIQVHAIFLEELGAPTATRRPDAEIARAVLAALATTARDDEPPPTDDASAAGATPSRTPARKRSARTPR
jgi:Fe-S-cluster containining protein